MPKPSSRKEIKDYALRKLGQPVIKINVSPEQLDDRLDDALEFFGEYHEDGVERTILKHQITASEAEFGQTTGWIEFDIPDNVFSVIDVFPLADGFVDNFFDVRYQILLSDVQDWGTFDLVGYNINRNHWQLLDNLLNQPANFEYKRVQNKLKLYLTTNGAASGGYILFEVYAIIDPEQYNKIFNNRELKEYYTAIVKRQWGSNLSKFNNVQLPGGVSFNGDQIYQQAEEEIRQIEERIRDRWIPGGFLA